jgi:hypothetical protein
MIDNLSHPFWPACLSGIDNPTQNRWTSHALFRRGEPVRAFVSKRQITAFRIAVRTPATPMTPSLSALKRLPISFGRK